MRKLLVLLIIPLFSIAQNNINYQAIVSNSDGTVISSQSIDVKLSVIYNSGTVYSETHTTTTTSSGLINIKLGSGGSTSGTFANIDWSTPSISLKSEVNLGNGYVNMGTQQIEAVPVALFAKNVNLLDANNTIAIGGLVSSTNSVAIGHYALSNSTSGESNVAIGERSMSANNNSGSWNTAVGAATMINNSTGTVNTAIGSGAMEENTTGSLNTALGHWALNKNTTASENTAVGAYSLSSVTANTYGLTAIGYKSLENNTTGWNTTALGHMSLNSNTTGADNLALGAVNSESNTTGSANTSVGSNGLKENTIGSDNTTLGYLTLKNNIEGDNNTAVGSRAGEVLNTDSNSNTFLGSGADTVLGTTINNSTAIGSGAIVAANNTIQLGNSSVALVQTSGTISATAFVGDGSGLTGISGPIYKSSMVLQSSSAAATDSQIDLPGLSFRWKKDSNGVGKLEVKAESDNAPQDLMFYFSYHTDSNDTINFRPDSISASTSSWSAVDCSWCASSSPPPTGYTPNLPSITGAYAVYEFDFSVYPLNTSGNHLGRTYNVKLFLGGWGGVHMRASYQ